MKHYFLLFIIILFSLSGFSLSNKPDSEFLSQLEELKDKDNLSGWIDLRIQYTGENPANNLEFLMSTQKECWRKLKNEKEIEAWLYLLINQGYYQLYIGDILKSIESYEKAYDFLSKNNLKIDAEEYILKPLANNYTRIGDYEKAIFIQEKSLKLALNHKNDSLSASIYNNLAISYLFKKEYRKAEQAVANGLKLVNSGNNLYGLLYSVLADINFQEDQLSLASKNILTSLKYLRKNNQSPYWLLSAYTLAGNIKFKQELFNDANLNYNEGISIIEKYFSNARKRELAHLLTQKGKIDLQNGKYNQAQTLFNKALTNLIPSFKSTFIKNLPLESDLYGENKLQEVLLAKAKAFKLAGDNELSLKASLLAFNTSEKIREEYTYNASKQQLQAASRIQAEQIINIAYELWLKTKNEEYAHVILVASEKTKARILLDEILDNQQKLASTDKKYAQKINLERAISYYERQYREKPNKLLADKIAQLQFQLSSIQKSLRINSLKSEFNAKTLLNKIPSDTKTLSFFFGDESIFLIDAQNGKINTIKKIGNAKIIEKQVYDFLNLYFYNGPSQMMNSPSKFYKNSFDIYTKLFSHINLKEARNLIIIKDGVLNLLSFESLVSDSKFTSKIEKWPYLIKTTNITYDFSLNTLADKIDTKSTRTDIFNGFFISNTGDNNIEIPAAEEEYSYLKKLLKGSFFKNEKATVSNFKKSFSRADVLHISSHAFISKKDAGPVLELYKNKFYLLELGAQYKVPKLVVLSACQTADGELIAGEGVMSMSRGFIASGTKGVISGLWKVNDKAGAELMNSFYTHLLINKNIGIALRNAKLNWINKDNKNKVLLLPYYWDSLIYTGNHQFIELDKYWIDWKIVFIILPLSLTIYLFLRKRRKANKA